MHEMPYPLERQYNSQKGGVSFISILTFGFAARRSFEKYCAFNNARRFAGMLCEGKQGLSLTRKNDSIESKSGTETWFSFHKGNS